MKNKIIFRDYEVIVESRDNKAVKYTGDETLIGIIKPILETPIQVMTGGDYKEDDSITLWDAVKELKPGDKNYIKAVLMEKIRNELGMEVEL